MKHKMERTIKEGSNKIFDRCDLSISLVLHFFPDGNGIWNLREVPIHVVLNPSKLCHITRSNTHLVRKIVHKLTYVVVMDN
jgi:hypothetical protein